MDSKKKIVIQLAWQMKITFDLIIIKQFFFYISYLLYYRRLC